MLRAIEKNNFKKSSETLLPQKEACFLGRVWKVLTETLSKLISKIRSLFAHFTPPQKHKKLPQVTVINQGLSNGGNTCYIAALLQALFAANKTTSFSPSSIGNLMHSFSSKWLQSTAPLPPNETEELAKNLASLGWKIAAHKEGDPVDLYDFLHPHLQNSPSWLSCGKKTVSTPACKGKNIRTLEEANPSLTEALKCKRKTIKIDENSPPSFFALHVAGRGQEKEERIEKRVSVPDQMDIPSLQNSEKVLSYQLGSIVMYRHHHYYTLKPHYTPNGKMAHWTEYNDAQVTEIHHSDALQEEIEKNGYLFFYSFMRTPS